MRFRCKKNTTSTCFLDCLAQEKRLAFEDKSAAVIQASLAGRGGNNDIASWVRRFGLDSAIA
jgi:hypothetical protein